MTEPLQEEYVHIGLPEIIERLCNECYHALDDLCENASLQSDKLAKIEYQPATSHYLALCNKLIAEIKDCLNARRTVYIPYVKTLLEKVDANHNCSTCTGNCKLNHDMQLIEMQASHTNIKSILYRLQMVSLPLYSETIYPNDYRILRNQMGLIENNLTELFFLEEKYLIPKVIEAQNKINAAS